MEKIIAIIDGLEKGNLSKLASALIYAERYTQYCRRRRVSLNNVMTYLASNGVEAEKTKGHQDAFKYLGITGWDEFMDLCGTPEHLAERSYRRN